MCHLADHWRTIGEHGRTCLPACLGTWTRKALNLELTLCGCACMLPDKGRPICVHHQTKGNASQMAVNQNGKYKTLSKYNVHFLLSIQRSLFLWKRLPFSMFHAYANVKYFFKKKNKIEAILFIATSWGPVIIMPIISAHKPIHKGQQWWCGELDCIDCSSGKWPQPPVLFALFPLLPLWLNHF